MAWEGTMLRNTGEVRLVGAPSIMASGGVFVWPTGTIATVYTDPKTRRSGFIIPLSQIMSIEFGPEFKQREE